jgi:hypothetical protein
LFEIKAGLGAQAHFTAIGQLLVYSSQSRQGFQKVLVSMGVPASQLFSSAFKSLDIALVSYALVGKRVVFTGLKELIDRGKRAGLTTACTGARFLRRVPAIYVCRERGPFGTT